MKFTTVLVSLALAAVSSAVTLSYDTVYDDASTSLDVVACSDGTNGMEAKGYTTFGSLPTFPLIGGAAQIGGWNSASCGTCWQVCVFLLPPSPLYASGLTSTVTE